MITVVFSSDPKVSVRNTHNLQEWTQYNAACTTATIYHLPEWSAVLEKSFGYIPYHLFAKDAHGRLLGILPLFLIKSSVGGNRLVSLPFSHFCGPIVDSNTALEALLEEAIKLCNTLKCKYLEIKMISKEPQPNIDSVWTKNGFEVSSHFSTFLLELSKPDTVWKKLDPKSVRWAIGKARRDGVRVKKSDSLQDIRCFYNLNLKTKKRIGVPGHPHYLFENIFQEMGDRATLYLAELQNAIIAGIITLKYNDTTLYAYAASDDNYRVNQPNSLLVWTAIEEACNDGYRYFDFGRTSSAEESVTSFKKHWGTEEKMLAYYYYPHIPNSMVLGDSNMLYSLATMLWKKMPLSLAGFFSNRIFKYLG